MKMYMWKHLDLSDPVIKKREDEESIEIGMHPS